jgi:hypothetical protein
MSRYLAAAENDVSGGLQKAAEFLKLEYPRPLCFVVKQSVKNIFL